MLVGMMLFINRQYRRVRGAAGRRPRRRLPAAPRARIGSSCRSPASIGPSSRRSTSAGRSARTSGPSSITDDAGARRRLRADWERRFEDVPLDIVETAIPDAGRAAARIPRPPRRDAAAWQDAPVTFVIVPEFVARHWWERGLYNQSAQAASRRPDRAAAHRRRRHVRYRREAALERPFDRAGRDLPLARNVAARACDPLRMHARSRRARDGHP